MNTWHEGDDDELRTHHLGKLSTMPGHDVLVVAVSVSRVLLEDPEHAEATADLVSDMARHEADKAVRNRMGLFG